MPITEAQQLQIQNRVTVLLAEARDLEAAAGPVLEAIGAGSGWAWGSLWMLDEAGEALRIQTTWCAPDFDASAFRAASEVLTFAPGKGLPGLAWSEGRPQWMGDLAGDPRFVRGKAAGQVGLRSGFAFPIRLQDQVLGVMAFFSRQPRTSDPGFLAMMDSLGSQMGQFIERKRAEATLRRSEERYRAVVEQSGEGIYLFDVNSGAILESNPAFQHMLGYESEEMAGLTLFDVIAHERESIQANLGLIRETGQFRIAERRYRRKDGSSVVVEVAINRLTLSGGRMAVAIVYDLSTRRRLEAERDRLVEILEATTDFVGMADLQGHALYGNRAMRELRGDDSPELNRPIADGHPPWALKKVMEEGFPTAMREGAWRGETAFLDREGREVPVSQLILIHRDAEGRPTFSSTVARDISVEKTKERELQEALKRHEDLRYAVDESTIFAITDRRGVIMEVNRRFCEVSGYAREELLGKSHAILKSGRHPKAFFKEMWDTILAGRIWRGEILNRAKDGSLYWVDTTIVPGLNAQGRPERFIALRTVITERKRAEEALLRRERQLEAMGTAAQEINSELDIRTVMRRLVEAALRLTDATEGGFGMLKLGRVEFRECLQDGAWGPVEYDFEAGQGVAGHVMETLQPYLSNDPEHDPRVSRDLWKERGFFNLADIPILGRKGNLLGAIEIHNTRDHRPFDDSDLKILQGLAAHAAVALENALRLEETLRHEEALRHTQKLESLGLLAGGIAHDFNNLLGAILGNLSLAMLDTPPNSATTRHLQSIDRAVMRAADLTRQMLAYAGKGTFLLKRLDLNGTVEEIARLLEASISKKIRLDFHLHPNLPGLDADPAQVEQLILNLVTNAADAIGDREGTIRLATDFQALNEGDLRDLFPGQTLAPGSYLTLDVTDDGSGIRPEILDRIFDPFFTTKTTGRGLGLSAMLGILRAHRGGIKIYTEPDRGTTFRLFLPAIDHGQATQEALVEALPWKGQGTVLVVDDDDEVRAATRAQVESLGFQTLEARDGLEALELFSTRRDAIDLVVMDFSMPRLDGREALRAMRNLDPKAKVILCSGFEEGGPGRRADDEAPTAFLQKPFRLGALSRVLREALEGQSAR